MLFNIDWVFLASVLLASLSGGHFAGVTALEPQTLWPIPQLITTGQQAVRVALPLQHVDIDEHIDGAARSIIDLAVERLYATLLHPVSKQDPLFSIDEPAQGTLSRLRIVMSDNASVPLATWPDEGVLEWYQLQVDANHNATATITSVSVFGAIRGLQTLRQLIETNNTLDTSVSQSDFVLRNLPITIEDWPRFQHRGLMIDTSRSFIPLKDLYRTLDAMHAVKLNVFHWHIIDSQSFPLQSERVPQLWKKGAYSLDKVYSARDIADLIQYARYLGIRVIPEFDTPGHTTVWGRAFPQLLVCAGRSPNWDKFAAEPPSGQLDITNPEVYVLLDILLGEQADWFHDSRIHMGGDEVNMHCYNETPHIATHMRQQMIDATDLVRDHFRRVFNMLTERHKKVIAWEEVILDYAGELSPQHTLVQVWRGADRVQQLLGRGYSVIASPSDYWYLDCGHGEWINAPTGNNSWCDPFKTWQKMYTYDIGGNQTTTNAATRNGPHVVGGEAALWTEQVDEHNLDGRIWPRTAAVAEVLWSGRRAVDGTERTTRTALPRLMAVRRQLLSLGVHAEPVQMLWCELHRGMCEQPVAH